MAARALLAQLVEHLHGKEGVDGSSPSEGSAKSLLTGIFVQKDLLLVARALGMEPFVELSRSGSLETSLQAS